VNQRAASAGASGRSIGRAARHHPNATIAATAAPTAARRTTRDFRASRSTPSADPVVSARVSVPLDVSGSSTRSAPISPSTV
jgi:hypothetical protein